jgi:mRNA interferase HigB
MHVISFKRIREFFSSYPGSESALTSWTKIARKANWQNFAELKSVYPTADLVGRFVVFNIGGNKYRLIARIVYRSQTVFVIRVMTHKEYDLGKWKE